MYELIKRIVQNVLDNWDLTDYVAGSVVKLSPLSVRISDRLILMPANLIPAVDTSTLIVGDRLILLRVQRGQKYIILSKEVD